MREFNGKTVYIFGGSSGIGLETGKLLAAAGAHVFIFARTAEKLKHDHSRIRRQADLLYQTAISLAGVGDYGLECEEGAERKTLNIKRKQFLAQRRKGAKEIKTKNCQLR